MIFCVFCDTDGIRIRDAEAAGSNPVASTLGRGTGNLDLKGFPVLFIFCRRHQHFVDDAVYDYENSNSL